MWAWAYLGNVSEVDSPGAGEWIGWRGGQSV